MMYRAIGPGPPPAASPDQQRPQVRSSSQSIGNSPNSRVLGSRSWQQARTARRLTVTLRWEDGSGPRTTRRECRSS